MKKLFLVSLLIWISSVLSAQIQWSEASVVSEGTPVPESFSLFNDQVVFSGLYFFESSVGGSTLPGSHDGNSKAFISSLDEENEVLWKYNLSATGSITKSVLEVVGPSELVWLVNFSGSITIDQNVYISHGGKDVLALFINELGIIEKTHHIGTRASDHLEHVYPNQHHLNLLIKKNYQGDSIFVDGTSLNYGHSDFWNITLSKSNHLPTTDPIDLGGEEEDVKVFSLEGYSVMVGTTEKSFTGNLNEHHAYIRKVGMSKELAWEIMDTDGQYSMMSAAGQMGSTTLLFGGYVDSMSWQNSTLASNYMHAHFLAGVNAKGELLTFQSIEGMVSKSKIDCHSDGSFYLSGQFSDSLRFDENNQFYSANPTFFIAKYNMNFELQYVQVCNSSDAAYIVGLKSDAEGNLWTVGQNQGQLSLGNQVLNTQVKNIFIANNKGPGVPNSIENLKISETLNVYPNPIKNGQSLKIETEKDISKILIFNLNGQLIFDTVLGNSNITQINTHTLKAGVYSVVVLMADGGQMTKKIIILN